MMCILHKTRPEWLVAQAFGGMFCISGLLGIYGSCATLAGYCLSRHFGIAGINVFKLKVTALGCTH